MHRGVNTLLTAVKISTSLFLEDFLTRIARATETCLLVFYNVMKTVSCRVECIKGMAQFKRNSFDCKTKKTFFVKWQAY